MCNSILSSLVGSYVLVCFRVPDSQHSAGKGGVAFVLPPGRGRELESSDPGMTRRALSEAPGASVKTCHVWRLLTFAATTIARRLARFPAVLRTRRAMRAFLNCPSDRLALSGWRDWTCSGSVRLARSIADAHAQSAGSSGINDTTRVMMASQVSQSMRTS